MFLDKISNPVLAPEISCPASRCVVPPFNTMATCRSCEEHIPQNITCQYTANGMLHFRTIEEFISIANSMELTYQELVYKDWQANCTVTDPSGGISDMILATNNLPRLRGFSIDIGAPMFQWKDDLTTIVKITGYQPISWPSTREEFETWNGFTGNITVCKIKYCVYRYHESGTTENGKFETSMPTETALEYDVHENADMSGSDFTFNESGSKEEKYAIVFRSIYTVSNQIFLFAHRMLMADSPYNTLDSYLADTPWEVLAQGLSSVATSIINSDQNMNSTKLEVTAYELEVYIRVRWLWFILPLSTVLLAALFLILSIVRSKDEVKFKSSVLAPLFHGLERWQQESGVERGDERLKSARGLLHIADEMSVVLKCNDRGYLSFIR
jgi:hypothetical protein